MQGGWAALVIIGMAVLAMACGGTACADAPEGAILPASLYDELRPLFDNAAGGIYWIHGRDATGVGPGLEWQMFPGCERLRFNLIAARSSKGGERLIPGIGVLLLGGDGTPDVTLGVCWAPSEYGMARIGELKTYAAPYVGLRMAF